MLSNADLILFLGQSNMAGRGVVCNTWPQAAPALIPNAGYEFRAVSDPTKLYPVTEPFGVHENKKDGICDVFPGNTPDQPVLAKTGSCVTSFCNSYYQKTHVPVVAVSASKGGSTIAQWQDDSPEGYLADAVSRLQAAKQYLLSHGCHIDHQFVVWCQGESDGDIGTDIPDYQRMFCSMMGTLRKQGIEKCFLIKTGYSDHRFDDPQNQAVWDRQYQTIQNAQEHLAMTIPDVMIVSRAFPTMRGRGLMKDAFHYYQQAYNECGEEAGNSAAGHRTTDAVSFSILGDSFSTYKNWIPTEYKTYYGDGRTHIGSVEETWWYMLGQTHNMKLVDNCSYSCSTVCTTGYDGIDDSQAFVTRMKDHFGKHTRLNIEPDIILIEGGINDTYACSPVGTVQYADWTEQDLQKSIPAYCYMLHYLRTQHPDARIVCMISVLVSESLKKGYLAACAHYHAEYVIFPPGESDEELLQDGHPTAKGHQAIFEAVNKMFV